MDHSVTDPESLLVRADRSPLRWSVEPALAESIGITARDRSAAMIAGMRVDDGAPLNGSLGATDMEALFSAAERHLLDSPLSGIGIELGAGLGVLAATVAKRPQVRGLFAVEVCPSFVELVIPAVAAQVLQERADVVVPTLGSFDRIELDDASLDFAVEIDSLHHADDLDAALSECARVLRPGARLVCFDRVQPDDMPESMRDQMLDRVYPPEWIRENGYPEGAEMTRRENGEHEIRLAEWKRSLAQSGFNINRIVRFIPNITARLAMKASISWLPGAVRRRLVTLPAPREYAWAWARSRVGSPEAVGIVAFAPRLTTGISALRL